MLPSLNVFRTFVVLVTSTALALAVSPALSSDRAVLPAEVVPERYDIKIIPNAKALSFTGEVDIAISVLKATNRIVLNAADLTIGHASLSGGSDPPQVVFDETQQTASFVFQTAVAPGSYVLSIKYAGKIYQQFSGLFALDYDTAQGQRRALFTQFQNSDARRFVPSWDEPARKAVFALTVLVPSGEMAISNMPIATSVSEDGRMMIRFVDSPKMASYLLFLAVGDLERITTKVGDTEVGVVARRGETAKGKFALEAAVQLLGYYNDYFDIPYPLPKLDMVAAPGQSQVFSAMENWGAIRYLEDYLLLDSNSTDADKLNVFRIVAHEIAHQWFGNLVTMEWWDDLWLNEGFASWIENKATNHFHPEWKTWLRTAAGKQWAMKLDAGSGTHPIIMPIRDVFEAANAFDAITYRKGQAVVRMLEAHVGEDAFRAGVRNYIKRYAFGNAVTDDLWSEIDKISPQPVLQIAHDFTLQAGVPLVRVAKAGDRLKLSQDRFAEDDTSHEERTWRTPVIVQQMVGGADWRGIVSAEAPLTLPFAPVIVNAGQTGYFRVAYDRALWTPLVARFAALSPDDQLGLLYDSRALGEIGQAPMSDFLELTMQVDGLADPVVLNRVADTLNAYDYLYEGLSGRSAFRTFARQRLNPIFVGLGWDARVGEGDNTALLRSAILKTLGDIGDSAVIAEARRRFAAYVAQPDTLSGSAREIVLHIVSSNADTGTWDQIHALAKLANSPTDKSRLYALLGISQDPILADKALALALSDEPPKTLRPVIIESVASVFPERAFDFALENRLILEALLEPGSRYRFFADLASGARATTAAEKLTAYSETLPPTARGDVTKAIAAIRHRAKIIKTRLPEIDQWLVAKGG